MHDDDYNRFMRQESNSKHFAIIFLVVILMVCLLFWSVASAQEGVRPYVDEDCAASFACQSDRVTWELIYQGEVISEPNEDFSEEECEMLRAEVEPQTDPFSQLYCRPRLVERQDL